VREERWARADTLIRKKFGTVPFGDQALFASARGDSATLRQLRLQAADKAEQKGRRTSDLAIETGWLLGTYLGDLANAADFTRFGTAATLPTGLRGSAHQMLANLAIAGGRWSAAQTEFAAPEMHRDSALVGRALAATLPFLRVPRSDLERVRAELERWRPGSDVTAPLAESLRPLTADIRLYLLGLTSVRLGDAAGALRYADELERLSAPPESRPLVRDLSRTVRSDVAAVAGRSAEALSQLEAVKGEVPYELIRLPYFSGEYARYLRAELLYQSGRDREALQWYGHGFQGTPNELAYLAPSHLRQAELYDRLGERQQAVDHYSRFIQLWKGCDPELRPSVDRARSRLASLVGEQR
jgi:tetratricopeptide (TPR) repeat protein